MNMIGNLSVNQILVICLILILVVFLVFVGKLAVEALGLLKKTKVLVNDGQKLVATSQSVVNRTGDKLMTAANGIIDNASAETRAIVVAAGVVVAFNIAGQIRKYLIKQGGFVAHIADKRARKKTKKEINKTKKEIKKIKARTKAEKKMAKKAKKLSAKVKKAGK